MAKSIDEQIDAAANALARRGITNPDVLERVADIIERKSQPRNAASRAVYSNPPDPYAPGLAARGLRPLARPADYDPFGNPPDPYAPGLEKLRREQGISSEHLRTGEATDFDIFKPSANGAYLDTAVVPPDPYKAALEARRKENK